MSFLELDLAESDERARRSIDALIYVLKAVGNKNEATRLRRRHRAKRRPFRVDRRARKAIRDFATFCGESGGFYVS